MYEEKDREKTIIKIAELNNKSSFMNSYFKCKFMNLSSEKSIRVE